MPKTIELSEEAYKLTQLSAKDLKQVSKTHTDDLTKVMENNELENVFKCMPYIKQRVLFPVVRTALSSEEDEAIKNIIRSSRENDAPAMPIVRKAKVESERRVQENEPQYKMENLSRQSYQKYIKQLDKNERIQMQNLIRERRLQQTETDENKKNEIISNKLTKGIFRKTRY